MKEIRDFMKVCSLKFGWINKEDLGYFDFDKNEQDDKERYVGNWSFYF